jgi:phosphatidylserine/phosphatidylglycerophosphate/cardiolipin synthase-like enzyme
MKLRLLACSAALLMACTSDPSVDGDDGAGATGGGASTGNAGGPGVGGGGEGGAGANGGTGGMGEGGEAPTPGYTVDETVVSWHQPSLSASLHFAPLDDVEAHVLAQLEAAQTSIELAFFNIRLEDVRDLLIAKEAAGVTVKVVLDKKQQDLDYNTMGEELLAAGIDVTLVDNVRATDATMHDKFAVIDGHLLMTGSANYSYTALNVSDEDLLTVDDADLAARYQAELAELIAGGNAPSASYAGDPAMKAWMGPEDGLLGKVTALLDAAEESALVAMFQLNSDDVVDALVAAHGRGVNVIVVLDENQATLAGQTADTVLAGAGITVVLADNTGGMQAEMHSKFVVVDHERVMLGSYNWTNLGSHYNDENVVVIEDAHLAARVEGKLASLLQAYDAPAPATLGLTTGMQAVSFSIGNVTLDPGVTLVVEGTGPLAGGVELGAGGATVMVEAGTRLEYHYEIKDGSSTLATEASPHTFTVPYAPGPFAVSDAFQL